MKAKNAIFLLKKKEENKININNYKEIITWLILVEKFDFLRRVLNRHLLEFFQNKLKRNNLLIAKKLELEVNQQMDSFLVIFPRKNFFQKLKLNNMKRFFHLPSFIGFSFIFIFR